MPVTDFTRGPRGWRFYLSAWLPVIFAMGCIALESQPWFGADHTSGPLRWLVEKFTGPLADRPWAEIHHLIRKTGHFCGYGLVSLTWFRAFWKSCLTERSRWVRQWTAHLLAMVGTLLIASCDEFHQTFLPNRTGMPVDVLIDCSGGLIVQLLVFFLLLRSYRGKRPLSY